MNEKNSNPLKNVHYAGEDPVSIGEQRSDSTQAGRSTNEFAASHLVLPQSVRVRLCQTGSYFGIVPEKLPNGRLMWP